MSYQTILRSDRPHPQDSTRVRNFSELCVDILLFCWKQQLLLLPNIVI